MRISHVTGAYRWKTIGERDRDCVAVRLGLCFTLN